MLEIILEYLTKEASMGELITVVVFGLSLLLSGVFKKKIICVNLDDVDNQKQEETIDGKKKKADVEESE
jgi:hypothetical protein